MNNILEINNVTKKYGDYTALNNVTLSVPQGSIYGLLGPNGAGKTSLRRIINQITMPDTGEVLLDGEKLNAKHIAYIGYMPEERGSVQNNESRRTMPLPCSTQRIKLGRSQKRIRILV